MIELRNVTKVYERHDIPALTDVNIKIERGEFVFLVGPSGSGKSTFIRLLIKELEPTSGQIIIAGQDLTQLRHWKVPYLRRNLGCIFQDYKLLSEKTTFENVAFALEVLGTSRHLINDRVPEILRLVGLEGMGEKYPHQLSGGEQQRVSIARAFVNRPPIMLADEPTGNLDPTTSQGIMSLLEAIVELGTTVIMATHDREMVDNMRKRVIALEDGSVIRDQDRGVYGTER